MKKRHKVNSDLRFIASMRGVTHTDIARELDISPARLADKMRRELSNRMNNKILEAIMSIWRRRNG